MNEPDALKAFAALSNESRLRLVKVLVEAGAAGLSAGEVAERISAAPSRASFHLTALSEAGLVRSERESRSIRYFVRLDAMGGLVQYLLEDCCGGNSLVRECCRG
ncbi:ArsR/SmtB family transcription factor [Cognatishimia activa]|uniref:Helix-turn-helix domain protein n=1 Tax=Cognatishimia activa TaxID=1715691 RepID=A0A0P1J8L1_9RHOB|nr:metalloregulator ArsR/SmtB family transcription factor [Cognatishimia activa]CUI61741.1 Helix-turn-helix domain protein [Cognatishimia activa]CUK26309.1 Helix-turn-helix domain protein [Cognatishimia activa]